MNAGYIDMQNTLDAAKTSVVPFERIPADEDKPLFQTAADANAWHAMNVAATLTNSAHYLLQQSVGDGETSTELVYLCAFALEAAEALRSAAGVNP